jgi:hypothetical protein
LRKAIIIFAVTIAFLQAAEPKFDDYQTPIYGGKIEQNKEAKEAKINFAGKYHINAQNCLGWYSQKGIFGCYDLAIFNLQSGAKLDGAASQITGGDFLIFDPSQRRFNFSANSSLLIASLYEKNAAKPYRTVYYRFESGEVAGNVLKKFDEFIEIARVDFLPQEVVSAIELYENCEHFGGEEPYDDERAKEIAEAMKPCDKFYENLPSLIKKYKDDKEAANALSALQERVVIAFGL